MKRIFFSIFIVSCFFTLGSSVYADTLNVTNLVFFTEPQTVAPGNISAELRVQTQNASGASESISETNDVTFTSNSPSGEFLNSSGNAVSKTMSKNTSARAFYYRDSSVGTFTLTLEIKGRDSGTTFTSSQDIVISNEIIVGTSTSTTATSTTSTTATTTVSSTNTSTQILSSHSSTQVITYVSIAPELKVDAGRNRLTTTKSSIEFEAETTGGNNVSYTWSFGDGTSGTGKIVNHEYKFVGDYNVVLNAKSGGKSAVSRTEVKVVGPEVEIVNLESGEGGFIELVNNSSYEVNMDGWKFVSNNTEVVIAPDTIIKANSKIKLPFVFPQGDSEITLLYSNSTVAQVFGGASSVSLGANEPSREQIEEAKNKVARQFASNALVKSKSQETGKAPPLAEVTEPTSLSTLSIIETVESNQAEDNSLLATPKKFFKFIGNFFTK